MGDSLSYLDNLLLLDSDFSSCQRPRQHEIRHKTSKSWPLASWTEAHSLSLYIVTVPWK